MKAVIEMARTIGDKGMFYIPFVVYLLNLFRKGDASAKYK